MDEGELALIDELLSSELGRGARFRLYDRENRTPMNFVLDEVERQLGPDFLVYWVDGGGPEVFCLTGFSKTPVAFSTRYLELTAFVRDVVVHPFAGELRARVAEETALKVIAELSLRHGDPDLAVLALAKAEIDRGIYLQQHDRLLGLEDAPIDEAYMAVWFYGLVHELGHAVPHDPASFERGTYSDDGIAAALEIALERFPYPESLKAEAMERARVRRADSLLGLDHLRNEATADLFATSVLLQSTADIMQEGDGGSFGIGRFVVEMYLFLNILIFLDRCARVARRASKRSIERDDVVDMGLAPVALQVRALMQRGYLNRAAAVYLHGNQPTEDQERTVEEWFDASLGGFRESIEALDTGLGRAMEFVLFPERRPTDRAVMEAFRQKAASAGGEVARAEARRFCDSAEDLGRNGDLLGVLRRIVEDPEASLAAGREGEPLYWVP